MVSTVAAERSKLHGEYPELRLRILNHYDALSLVGASVDAKTYKLPRKLGHWGPQHSAKVRAACPELEDVIQAIERLLVRRDPEWIDGQHVKRKSGVRRRSTYFSYVR